jgi:hypothetical protein
MLSQVYEVYLPAKMKDGTVGLSPAPLKVDLINHAKIPLLWAQVGQQGIDVQSIVGMTVEELLQEAVDRQALVTSIQKLSDTLLEYLARIPSDHSFSTVEEVLEHGF